MNEWIECSEKMSPVYDYVLVCADNKGTDEPKPINIATWNGEEWIFLNEVSKFSIGATSDIAYVMKRGHITHWKPLPKPPTE